jgi:hypothetical protein
MMQFNKLLGMVGCFNKIESVGEIGALLELIFLKGFLRD